MTPPFRLNLEGGRWVPFIATLPLIGIDLTGATFAMALRDVFDGAGAALASLANAASAAAEGVRVVDVTTATVQAHITAGRLPSLPVGVNPATGEAFALTDSIIVTRIGIRINETTMEGLPMASALGGERGDELALAWDMHVTPSGGNKTLMFRGTFTVLGGAVQ
jgi:hypothetical protein